VSSAWTATTKYRAGVVPTFFRLCITFDAVKTTAPGPICPFFPSESTSSVPSRISRNSEWLCRWGLCGICPAGRVVSCDSTYSPVGSVPWITARLSPPLAECFTGSLSNGKISECDSVAPSALPVCAPAATLPIAAKAERATQRSRRFKFFMPTSYATNRPVANDAWHVAIKHRGLL